MDTKGRSVRSWKRYKREEEEKVRERRHTMTSGSGDGGKTAIADIVFTVALIGEGVIVPHHTRALQEVMKNCVALLISKGRRRRRRRMMMRRSSSRKGERERGTFSKAEMARHWTGVKMRGGRCLPWRTRSYTPLPYSEGVREEMVRKEVEIVVEREKEEVRDGRLRNEGRRKREVRSHGAEKSSEDHIRITPKKRVEDKKDRESGMGGEGDGRRREEGGRRGKKGGKRRMKYPETVSLMSRRAPFSNNILTMSNTKPRFIAKMTCCSSLPRVVWEPNALWREREERK